MPTVTYQYSKYISIFCMLVVLFFIVACFYNLYTIDSNDSGKFVIIALAFCLCALFMYLVLEFLIPAFTNKVALELTTDSLIFYIGRVTINWKDVQKIDLMPGRTRTKYLYIIFKKGSEYADNTRIPLAFVAGRGSKIYETIKGYVDVGC